MASSVKIDILSTYLRSEEWLRWMARSLRNERPAQIQELLQPACFPSLLPAREIEIVDGLRANVRAGGVHDEDYLVAGIREFFDSVSDGVYVGGEGFGVLAAGACAGEGDYGGWVVVL